MKRIYYSKKSKTIGLPPGSFVYTGEESQNQIEISLIEFNETIFKGEKVSLDNISSLIKPNSDDTVKWIKVVGIHDARIIEEIGSLFELHPLLLEDILNPQQRPKIDEYDRSIYLVLKTIHWIEKSENIDGEQISLVLGKNFVISFQEFESKLFDVILERLKKSKGKIRSMKADFLTYSLLDVIVDNYFVILEKEGEIYEEVESELIDNPEPSTLKKIHDFKRDAIFLRKNLWPLRDMINKLYREPSFLLDNNVLLYFRDLHDHTIQIIDNLENLRDLIAGMLDLYLSSFANRQNDIMKILTIISTIFIPLTFIAGIYGMNFQNMPELLSPWGYPIVWAIMIVIVMLMALFFHKKKWL